jgi:hypothetical protein
MDNRRERQLEERIAHLEIEVKSEREWNEIPESLKPTSKGRWDQMAGELKAQESRRLGWPKNY